MIKYVLPVIFLCLLSPSTFANWQINNELSRVNFVSIKKNTVGEAHYFKKLSGSLSDDGKFTVTINLASVETLIPIRNERMQKYLFHTDIFPSLNLTADLSKHLKNLKTGHSQLIKTSANLVFNGVNKKIIVEVLATQQHNGDINIASLMPIIIKPSDFKLSEGVEKLQSLAKLPSITQSVPVSFVLTLVKQ